MRPFLLLAVVVVAVPLASQEPSNSADNSDTPPSRVARLNWMTGDVSFQPAGLEDWTNATLNYPLTTNDHLYTGRDSRVEMHIGPNAIRVDGDSNFGFLNLDDNIVQVSLTQGSMEIHLNVLADDDSFEIATPDGAITLLRTGDYRIDTDADHDASMLTVRAGQAELFLGSSTIIRAHETAYFRQNQPVDIRSANDTDDFDSFTAARDSDIPYVAPPDPTTVSRRRPMDRFSDPPVTVSDLVSEGMTGAEDLATTGTWQNDPTLGSVWSPPVSADWSPYSDGSWTYEEPWGWTWVDAAPWGFAPYHYGRWTYFRGRWVWAPGPRIGSVSYAPALVTFWGSPAAGSVSFAPLGPSETFNGSWMAVPSGALFPIRHAANQNAPNAIHSMTVLDFTSGVQSRPIVVASPEGQLLGSAPMVAPQRESIVIGAVRTRPVISNRPLIARTAPPPAPIALNYRLDLLKKNQGRPLAAKQIAEVRRQAPFAAVQQPTVRYTQPLVAGPRATKSASTPQRQAPGRSGR
jgi:hypothetical protein